ncbi:hypothetical protein SELMODRAFT_409717 [Selaginella moellendorffii]|uniref:Uncharacterized protein n=1 Tax=Selaginella moellendorffii TaxID=88036 RepID=D8RC80_SELML|nr:uncharacterized protein LOC9651645 [Selaginella moellendorffii]EFJ30082.1 hypothetical protein SELMODRAFT_409717 [Selaginella moellendorffii]|eukprot:XP_002968966.1 uncharacterized protein LOC9651645 [Selaginella moellendorffii]
MTARAWPAGSALVILLLVSTILLYFVPSRFRKGSLLLQSGKEVNSPQFSQPSGPSTGFDLLRLSENGTRSCHNVSTAFGYLFGVPRPEESSGIITLSTDQVHRFWIVSFAADGSKRCFGGDFYETDLSGPKWKSRPPTTDFGDGSYLVELKVDGDFAGIYSFKAILLFANLHGMDSHPERWFRGQEQFVLQINFTSSGEHHRSRPLPVCTSNDLKSSAPTKWWGQWTRSLTSNEKSCELDHDGRYLCLDGDEKYCETTSSRCTGTLASLESNGWVYSTGTCEFHLWNQSEAWQCLDGKKIFFWGDSNHQDTIRNLMNFVLGFHQGLLPRTFSTTVANPSNSSQKMEVVSVFNGHPDPSRDDRGLESLYEQQYREFVEDEFFRDGSPDAVILNSGLHDGIRWNSAAEFAAAADYATAFWKELVNGTGTRVIFRSTVTPAGASRGMQSNPAKMEAFNAILGEKIRRAMDHARFVDAYDMTFPWHYDHCCSDGGHYGRPPSLSSWHGGIGHRYFVDLMLVHILLTAICPS